MAQVRFNLQVLSTNAKVMTTYPCTYLTYCFLRMHYAHETVCKMMQDAPDFSAQAMLLYKETHENDIAKGELGP